MSGEKLREYETLDIKVYIYIYIAILCVVEDYSATDYKIPKLTFLFIDILMCASASIGMYYISK